MPLRVLRGRPLVPASSIILLDSGSAAAANGSVTLTTTADINPGDLVFVGAYQTQHTSTTAPIPTIANSGTAETWVRDQTHGDGNLDPAAGVLYRCQAANFHAAGSTITVASSGTSDDLVAAAFKVTPEQLVSPVALNASSSSGGTGASASPTSATPTRQPTIGCLVLGCGTTLTNPGGGWTTRYNVTGTLTSARLLMASLVKTDVAAVNNGATLGVSSRWVAMQGFYALAQDSRPRYGESVSAVHRAGRW